MSTPDMHKVDFDEGTEVKLHIYRQYLSAWIPVFPVSGAPKIQICDYFAGPGHDASGSPGSPMIAMDLITEHRGTLGKSGTKVILRLNDMDDNKVATLRQAVNERIEKDTLGGLVDPQITAADFDQIYQKEILGIQFSGVPSFIFIDQYGIKHVTEAVFSGLCRLQRTDFMFFVSSSFFKRFAQEEEFLKYHPKVNKDEIMGCEQVHVHRKIRQYYQAMVPANCETKVYSFTIKKNHNIYGLIFCTAHPLGAEKFINVAWEQNGQNGEANFDLDDDAGASQLLIFDSKRLTKKEAFESMLKRRILAGSISSNKEAYELCLSEGIQPSFGKTIITKMIDAKELAGSKIFGMTYRAIFKDGKITQFKLNRQ